MIGAIGGGVLFHGFKGYRNSPRGDRWRGSLEAIKQRGPILGGNFAVWSGLFNACECVLNEYRPRDDIWNVVIAGAATGSILAARSGPRAMMISGAVGGIILAAMEGAGNLMNRLMSGKNYDPVPHKLPEPSTPQE
jgi:import inner membrane translocase subunit TIM17